MSFEHDILLPLARAVDQRQLGAGAHLMRMARYCELIASGLDMSEEDVHVLIQAAPFGMTSARLVSPS